MAPDVASSTAAADEAAEVERALRVERVRLYGESLWSGLFGQAVSALLLLAVLHGHASAAAWAAWLGLLGLALGMRCAAAWWARRETDDGAPPSGTLLWRLRLAVMGSGAAWGSAALLLFPAQDLQAQTFLAFALAGMAAGSLTLTSFDIVAALGFATLAMGPMALRLLVAGQGVGAAMAAMVLLFTGFLAVAGWRAQRNVRDGVAARTAQALRAESLLRGRERLAEISEELARKSEALQVTLDSMEQGILSLGADGRTNFYNRRLIELTDLPESLLATRPTLDEIARYQLEHGHYGAQLESMDANARGALQRWFAGDKAPFPPTYLRRTNAGVMLEVKTRYLAGGGLVRTFADVTAYIDAQQRLQDSQAQARKLALVAAHTDNAVAILDAEGRIEWVNEGFTRLTGYTLDEIAGRDAQALLAGTDTDAEAGERMTRQLDAHGRAAAEILHYAKDGHAYWFGVETQAIVDEAGQVQRYIAIGRDVSARRAAEQALRTARDQAERASRAKSEFLSAMSHELRTPMNAILGFAQLLDTDPAHRLPERQRAQVQQILRAGEHLLALINDVLDLARVEAGKEHISVASVALAELVEECLELMAPLALERGIAMDKATPLDCTLQAAADRTRLKQVLLNLLSNAIKYNRPGGSVRLSCAMEAGELRLGITDTGVGLDAGQRARLFNAFERLGAEAGPVSGAGIGLALSKRIVELMHGRIEIDSEAGRGSTFWVCLPVAAPAAPAAARVAGPDGPAESAPRASPGERPRTVLYIEDNAVNVLLMEAALERETGLRLVTAHLPELGLDLARTERPDLVLLDIQLPGIDGFEVLRRLREVEATRATPVVAVSANAMPVDIERALAAGFDAYLTKPLDIERLLATVRRWLHAGASTEASGHR